jgi:hypothetical protein
MKLPIWFDVLLQKDGVIIFIDGRKESGKTDFGLKLAEYCYERGYRKHVATNIKTESYIVEKQITDLPTLKEWLLTKGKKTYVLDEAGKNLGKKRFMTNLSNEIMNIVQLIRHFDAVLIGIAPSATFIDSTFMDPEILDARIRKKNKREAWLIDQLHRKSIGLDHIKRTSIKFDSKDIADFTLQKKYVLADLPLCCKVAAIYGESGTYKAIKEKLGDMNHETIHRLIQQHMRHTIVTNYNK